MRLIRRRLYALLLCVILIAGLLPMTGTSYFYVAEASDLSFDSESVDLAVNLEMLAAAGASYATPEARADAVNKLRYRYIGEMLSHLGSPYVKGKGHFARSKEFDCSGLIAHAFIALGYSRYFSISEKSWNPGGFRAYDSNGQPSSAWKDFSWRGTHGLLENVKDGQKLYLIPDSSKNPVLVFTVRKSDKKRSDFSSDISRPAKWTDDFKDAVSRRGTILIKNHVTQEKWHTTAVVGYYDEEWFRSNGYDFDPSKASISAVKSAIRNDLIKEFGSFGLSSKSLNRVHRGLANGVLSKDKIGSKSSNSSFNDLDREDDVYPAMWDLRQRKITSERAYSPLWQVDALNPRLGVSVNNNTLALNQDYSIAMVLEWEEFGECHLTNYDDASSHDGEDRPIGGAVYAIYQEDAKDAKKKEKEGITVSYEELVERKPITTVTADADGEVRFRGITLDGVKHKGSYYIIELSPPEGCEPNRTVYPVTLTTDDDVEILEGGVTVSRYVTGSLDLQLDKEDCLTSVETGSYGIKGITLRAEEISDPRSELYKASAAYQILAAYDITRNGQILYHAGDVVSTISGSANGTVTADNLLLESYTVQLRTAPEGWSATNPGTASVSNFTLTESLREAKRVLTCSKEKLRVSFRICDSEGLPVAGGRYVLCCTGNIYDYTGEHLLIPMGTPIVAGTAGADGVVSFDAAGRFGEEDFFELMPAGKTYYLTELATPTGYLPIDGRLAEFTYASTEWAKNATAERSFSVTYEAVPPVAVVTNPPETITERTMTAGSDTFSVLASDSPNPKKTAVLPLIMLLSLLSGATVLLIYRRYREENA